MFFQSANLFLKVILSVPQHRSFILSILVGVYLLCMAGMEIFGEVAGE